MCLQALRDEEVKHGSTLRVLKQGGEVRSVFISI